MSREQPKLTPAQRSMRARMGAYALHAKHDPKETTKAATHASMVVRFERQVDPDGELDPEERARRVAAARSAYMAAIARQPRPSRKARAAEDKHAQKPLPVDNESTPIDAARRQAIFRATRNRHELGAWRPIAADALPASWPQAAWELARCVSCDAWAAVATLPQAPVPGPRGPALIHDCYDRQRRRAWPVL